MVRTRCLLATLALGCGLLACNPEATLFSDQFISFVGGGLFPVAPGPNPGYVMAYVQNNTGDSVEFVVTAHQEEIIVRLDGTGNIIGFDQPRLLEPVTVGLVTDVTTPTLGFVFDNTPASFPPVGPGELTFEDLEFVLAQLVARQPEILNDRAFFRLVRVLAIGLGPDLGVPSGADNGIIIRPAGSDPDLTAGAIFPSNVNSALSYNTTQGATFFPADFGNGDIVMFLAITNANAVGGVSVSAAMIDGSQANANEANFRLQTFWTLRVEEGPISPLPGE